MTWLSEVLADSPISYYRLGEAAGTEAADVQAVNKGTYQNAPTLGVPGAIVGEADTAITLASASKQYVSVPDSASLDFTDTVTYEVWVKRGTTGTQQTIIDKGSGSLIVRFTAGNKILVRRNNVANIVESTVTLTDTTKWHHIVVTKTGATVKIYLDGVDVTGTVTNSTLVNNAIALGFGAADGGTTDYLNGSLDEVAIYNTALSKARVEAHYKAALELYAGNLIGEPDFEDPEIPGWYGLSSPTLSRDTAEKHSGEASLKVVCDGSDSFEGAVYDVEELFAVGERYTYASWVKGVLGSILRLRIEDAEGPVSRNFIATGAWQRVSLNRVIAPGTTAVSVGVLVAGSQVTTYYVDDTDFALSPTIFTADWGSGDLSEWAHVQALPGRITVAGGSARFEIQSGDEEPETGDERAEVQSGLEYDLGDERYFRILPRLDRLDVGHWMLVWQIHDDSNDPPPVALFAFDDGDGPQLILQNGSGSPRFWVRKLPPRRERFEVVVRVKFGTEDGEIEVWFNGEKQTLVGGGTVIKNTNTAGNPACYDKVGPYRSKSSVGLTVIDHAEYQVLKEFVSDPPLPAPLKAKAGGLLVAPTRYVKTGGELVEA